ncbi:MAG TPA: ankyrin repeat domain-containing protein [Burkholderiales bacterium]|nr:ankyrin repeat domain-containing protein [Burkholderiales bacterium]
MSLVGRGPRIAAVISVIKNADEAATIRLSGAALTHHLTMISHYFCSTARALLVLAVTVSCAACTYMHAAINARLMEAVREGDARGAYLSLLAGADANLRDATGLSALHIAVVGNFEPVVDVLLAKGANLEATDAQGRTPLYAAHHARMVQMLASRGVALEARDLKGQTPLLFAIISGQPDAAKALIAAGAQVNSARADGITPLHAVQGQIEIASLLLARGAVIEARDKDGNTPLMSATAYGDLAVIVLLTGMGSQVNARNARGYTPLHAAAFQGNAAATKVLLDRGADVNARTVSGVTPLISAAAAGRADVVRLLIEKNAEVKARDQSGETALDAARSNGHSQVAAMLAAAKEQKR